MKIEPLRKDTYELAGLAFRRPGPELVRDLAADEAVDVLTTAVTLLPYPTCAWCGPPLWRFLAEVRGAGPAAAANNLLAEHCRLFIGPYRLPCPPYGSVYLDGGQAMGPSTTDAVSRYRREGLRVTAGWAEPPDHIAIELEFMSHLAARQIAAADDGPDGEAERLREVQRCFLRHHLGRWGPPFAEKLSQAASSPLYRFMSKFLPAWLAFDSDLLDASAAAWPGAHARCE